MYLSVYICVCICVWVWDLHQQVIPWQIAERERGSENEKRGTLGSEGLAHVISYAKHVPGLRQGAMFLLHTSGPQEESRMSLDPMCLCGMWLCVYMWMCVYMCMYVCLCCIWMCLLMNACGVKARGQGQVFSSVASLLGFLRQSLLLRLELTDLGRQGIVSAPQGWAYRHTHPSLLWVVASGHSPSCLRSKHFAYPAISQPTV